MTDQIYYKIQYPLKKAINIIKKVDPENPFAGKSEDIEKIKDFLDTWEDGGEAKIKSLVKKLRESK